MAFESDLANFAVFAQGLRVKKFCSNFLVFVFHLLVQNFLGLWLVDLFVFYVAMLLAGAVCGLWLGRGLCCLV